MRLFLLIGFILTSNLLRANGTDSLLQLLSKTGADTQRVNLLYNIGYAYWIEGEDDKAVNYCTQSYQLAKKLKQTASEVKARLHLVRIESDRMTDLKPAYAQLDTSLILAKKLKDPLLEGMVYLRRAQIYREILEKQTEVMPLMDAALSCFVKAGDKTWQGTIYNEKAQMLGNEGKFADGIDFLLKARKLQEEANDPKAMRSTLANLGVFYAQVRLHNQALQVFREAETLAINTNDEVLKAFIYNQRGEILEKTGDFKAALAAFEMAAVIHEKSQAVYWLPRTYARMGGVFIKMNDFDKGYFYTAKADSIYKSGIDANEALDHFCQINFGKIFLATEQYQKVIKYAETGLLWALEANPPLLKEAGEYHAMLATACEQTGKTAKALFHLKEYKTISDSLLNQDAIERISASNITYNFEKKQQVQELAFKELENEKLNQSRNFLLGITAFGFLLIGYVFWTNRKLKRKNAELERKNKEIEEAMLKGQRVERKRVALELHDNLNTKLAALRWRIEAIDSAQMSAADKKAMQGSLEMLEDIYADVRLISHSMIPAELETHGLSAAFHKLIEKLNMNSKTKFTIVEDLQVPRCDSYTEHQVYNIGLELINNVLKHAQASQVWISLTQTKSLLKLTVSDNGVGIDKEAQSSGIGMTNIRSRVDALHGKVQTDSGLGKGTKVEIEVKLKG